MLPTHGSVRALSDEELLSALRALAARASDVEAELLAHLSEVDARQLYLEQGYPSLFAYCTEALHFSEGSAYHRITAARAARAFPLVLDRLSSGELHLAGVQLLATHLTPENHVELLDRARHRSKRAIEELLAERAPKPDVPALVRRVVVPSSAAVQVLCTKTSLLAPASPVVPQLPVSSAVPESRLGAASPSTCMEPLGTQRYKVQFTADAGMHAKLREAQGLLRHRIPDGDLAAIFDLALSALLRDVRRARFAETDRPRTNADVEPTSGPASRHIPAAVRRKVAERDGGRCTFVAATGRRCDSRDALEFHHTRPFARSPHHSVEDITLRCRPHNRHAAVRDFGREHMSRFRKRNAGSITTVPGDSSPVRASLPTAGLGDGQLARS